MKGEAPILTCRAVGKVFRTYRRRPGLAGIWHNFFNRQYENFTALADVGLEIQAGEFVGLIGANGAGKTTLVKCLTGIIPVTSGRAELFGCDSFDLTHDHKRRLSLVMGQRSQLWWDLPAIDSFKLLREIYGVAEADFRRRLDDYAERLDVVDRLPIQLRQLSLGQRMKMEIIGAFLHRPDVVFLDEPTIGLDLISQQTIREFLTELNRERGTTVVLTSHDMEDIEETCRRLLILSEGSLLFDGDLVDLQRRLIHERAVEVHLEPGSRGWTGELDAELTPYGATLEQRGPLSLLFALPAANTQAFVKHLFDLFEVRDVTIERQPLDHLIKEIFATRTVDGARGPWSAPAGTLRRPLRLLWQALIYEFRRASAFRTGFIVREVLRGLPQPVVMIFVYHAMFRMDGLETLGGFTYVDMVHYLILVATFDKLIFHQRGLDLAEQIFEGYVTKFLVMPFQYFTLALGRWIQFMAVQLSVAALLWSLGALLLPDWWPLPASAAACGQALVLIVLGSYCFFLVYFIVNSLAFWLDVVWTLLVMVGFVGFFVRGTYVPVSVMPEAVRSVLVWLFPYWSLSAPLEIYLGRLGTPDFVRGLAVLLGSIALLELARRELWRRGTRRYTGSGM